MRLSPLDIKKQDFKRAMRGIDADEVQAFLQMVADQWQDLLTENERLEKKIIELDAKLVHYKQVEEAMQEALRTTRENSKQVLETARVKAKAVVDEAVSSATRIQRKARDEQYDLTRVINDLRQRKSEIIARLRALLNSELEILANFEKEYPDPNEDAAEAELDEVVNLADQVEEAVGVELEGMDEMEAIEAAAGEKAVGEIEAAKEVESAVQPEAANEFEAREGDGLDVTLPAGGYHTEDHLSFSTPDAAEEGRTPPAPDRAREAGRRDSPEMEKIRKILDELS